MNKNNELIDLRMNLKIRVHENNELLNKIKRFT